MAPVTPPELRQHEAPVAPTVALESDDEASPGGGLGGLGCFGEGFGV